MYDRDVQTVLRCELCNKPFDKQSTLTRHGYYCRSRRPGGISRIRSCVACAKRKARCDHRRPECSNCTSKAIECHYPANTPASASPRAQRGGDAPTKRRKAVSTSSADVSDTNNRQEASNDDNLTSNGAFVLSDTEFPYLQRELLDWDDAELDFVDFLNPQTNDDTAQDLSSGPSSLTRYSTPPTDQTIRAQQALSSLRMPMAAPSVYSARSLVPRSIAKTGKLGVFNLMLHTLKSYPRMILRNNTLPPFIHPLLISSDFENSYMEPLTNCISLVHMMSSGVRGSRKLFWKNVRLECERLYEESTTFNEWELLAAMQALSVYIIIRLKDGETDHNNFDFLLIASVTVIAKRLASVKVTCKPDYALRAYSVELNWIDWIFEESRRRLAVIYRVLDMLVYFEPATLCELQSDLVIAPLPAKKELWEAGDGFAWKSENEREPGAQTAFGLAASGELVELGKGQLYCSNAVLRYSSLDPKAAPGSTENWEEWCSGMDGFGGLVMLAASFVT